MMHGAEKSDPAIVAGKSANKAERSAAELVERRAGTKGNAGQQSTHRTQCRTNVSQALERIRKVSPSHTRGGSRMRESRTYGSVRGARGNSRPYREPLFAAVHLVANGTKRTFEPCSVECPLSGEERTCPERCRQVAFRPKADITAPARKAVPCVGRTTPTRLGLTNRGAMRARRPLCYTRWRKVSPSGLSTQSGHHRASA